MRWCIKAGGLNPFWRADRITFCLPANRELYIGVGKTLFPIAIDNSD